MGVGPAIVIVTSNNHPNEFQWNKTDLIAIKRRFKIIHLVSEEHVRTPLIPEETLIMRSCVPRCIVNHIAVEVVDTNNT